MSKIFTLNARGNVMLTALREHYAWSDSKTFHEIQLFHRDFLDVLALKGIKHDELGTALTPQPAKNEAAFLFDEHRCDPDRIPGVDAADALFRLLPAQTTHSILGGELTDDKDVIARRLLAETAVIAKDLNFQHPCFCYVLYVNNLSNEALETLHEGLRAHPGYLGYVPCTFASLSKTFVSLGLTNLAIKHKNVVILAHEDDRDNSEDYNLHLHDYTALGLRIKSLQSIYFGTFLSYKPERMLLARSDDDLEIAVRAMSQSTAPIESFAVLIDPVKFEQYLMTKKRGKLENAGLATLTRSELEEAVRFKIRSNYIYNLDWRDEPGYKGSFFNIMLEFPREGGYPERMTVAFEYIAAERILRLVTIA